MASIDSITIPFDWNDVDELELSLRNLSIVGFFKAARTANTVTFSAKRRHV
jgi:hypothetical protein